MSSTQFQNYMTGIQKVVSETAWSLPKVQQRYNEDPRRTRTSAPNGINLSTFKETVLDHHPPSSSLPVTSEFLHNLSTSGQDVERVNVAKFLREQDHLKGHVQELAEKLQLLHKDKAYLVGQNTFLERSNEELKGKLAAAENRLISLQRDRDELVKQAEAIHEKDRLHYLESFQKVLRNLDAGKMKDLNKAVRQQIHAYESQIRELQSITRELAAEKSSLRADLEKTTMQLSSLQLEKATSQAEINNEFLETKLTLTAKTHEYMETKNNLVKARTEIAHLGEQIIFLQEKNKGTRSAFFLRTSRQKIGRTEYGVTHFSQYSNLPSTLKRGSSADLDDIAGDNFPHGDSSLHFYVTRRKADNTAELMLEEYDRMKSTLESDLTRITGSLREKEGQLEAFSLLNSREVFGLQQSRLKRDEELQSRQRTIDDLSRQLIEIRTALHEKGNATAELDKRKTKSHNHEVEELTGVIRDQNREIMRLVSVVNVLKDQLRTEEEASKDVRKTRDELYEILRGQTEERVPATFPDGSASSHSSTDSTVSTGNRSINVTTFPTKPRTASKMSRFSTFEDS